MRGRRVGRSILGCDVGAIAVVEVEGRCEE